MLGFSFASMIAADDAFGATLRIVNWNIEADLNTDGTGTFASNGSVTPLATVLQGIGSISLTGGGVAHAQPVDAIALQEVGSSAGSSTTPDPVEMNALVSALNNSYGANTYAYVTTSDPVNPGQGSGPSSLIYNTKTLSVVSSAAIGTSSTSGAARAPMQYVLQPQGYGSAARFYLDVVHMKSGTDSTSISRRGVEAQSIVSNTQGLSSNSHVVVLGDFNITGGSSEATYTDLVGTSQQAGEFSDSGAPSKSWSSDSSHAALLSEHSYNVQYRDDMQLVSAAAGSSSGVPGLQYDSGSYTVFGNFGNSSVYGKSVMDSTNNPGSYSGLTSGQLSAVLTALAGTGGTTNSNNDASSDHLPIIADYDIVGVPTPEPAAALFLLPLAFCTWRLRRPSISKGGNTT
ncbi:MAG: hypothetical protein JO353_09215 [Phycisphaerae bacterium]|nr:hypothetical protein [Phycisphaerae bacterium]